MTTRIRRPREPSVVSGADSPTVPWPTGKAAIDLTANSPSKHSRKNPLASPSTPRLPHERDEAVGATGAVQSDKVRQGFRDVERGLQDTSRAPEADAAYDKLKK